ncbi:nucleotidyltransferase domain-containing protein [Candidatus Micrarchaeota archaeon]|nr:nucleotidyltransferase domain-containing protein [Candidatus Micrarchaeota archaeon]
MLSIFDKNAGFKILKYFLLHPSKEIHLKEIARKTKTSPGSVKTYCDKFKKKKIITSEKKGNLRIIKLNNDNPLVKQLKKTLILSMLFDKGIEKISKNEISLVVYGSCASGEFDERSDLDILIIGSKKNVNYKELSRIEKELGVEIQLTVIPYYEWEKRKKQGDGFVFEILKNYILIKGAKL